MSKKYTDKAPPRTVPSHDFENLDAIKDYFQSELEDGNNRFEELIGEAPEEYKIEVAKMLLEIEFRFYQEREWTYNSLARIEQFPQLKDFLENLIMSSGVRPSEAETVSNINLSATTQYMVDSKVWQQGGQGALHKGKDTGLGSRDIVVKFLKDLGQKAHFLKEAYVTANLDHPGIVAVYAKGFETSPGTAAAEHGRPFYAMRLVQGETLDRRIAMFHNRRGKQKGNPFAGEEFKLLIESLISVCSTIDYAHSRGVLHCDIKPANIKCGPFNATFVLDWGSAMTFDLASQPSRDTTRQLQLPDWTAGGCTWEFASPEQVTQTGRSELSPASDVYCIGTTMFQVLTGQPPFDHKRRETDVCPNPRDEDRAIPSRLAAICEKATAASQLERYPTVHDLGADLQHWLRDEEVAAMPDGTVEKVFRLGRRHKMTTLSAVLVIAMLIAGVLLTMGYRNRQLQNEVESAQLLATGNQAFSLVEKICQPVAQDETGGTTLAFANIVPELELFTNHYIDNISDDTDSQKKNRQEVYGATLVNAYRLKALVSYYEYNNPVDADEVLPEEHIQNAIQFLEHADQYTTGDSKDQAIYGLLKARLLYKKIQAVASDDVDLESVINELDKTIGYFRAIDESSETIEDRINHAEAHHLKGEVFLTFRGSVNVTEPEDPGATKIILNNSENEFWESIRIRQPLPDDEAFETAPLDTQKLVYREIGRGFGYLGDVQKYQLDIPAAIESYQKSLAARRKLVEKLDDSDEYQFQLARGWGNFGNLARDYGDEFERSKLATDLRENSDQPNRLLADLVGENYLNPSRQIREDLWQRTGDTRYRTDLAGLYNLFAELYLFAAMDAAETEKIQYFEKVKEFTQKVQMLYPDVQEASFQQNDRNRKASSLMLQLRAAEVQGQTLDSSIADELHELLNTNRIEFASHGEAATEYQHTISAMNFEALMAYCVGLRAQQRNEELAAALVVLNRKSNGMDSRIQRHFGAEPTSIAQ